MLSSFINFMRENLEPDEKNDSVILKWLELAIDMNDSDEADINYEVFRFQEVLEYVKNNFTPEVFQQCLRFTDITNEIVNCAFCFNAGYSAEEVENVANKGWLEDGYIPYDSDASRNLFLVKILEPENSMLLFSDVSEKIVLRSIGRASTESIDKGGTISSYIQKGIVCNSQNVCLINSHPLKYVLEKALENNTAIDRVITFNPVTGEVDFFVNETELHSDIEPDEAPSELGMNLK